MNRVRFDHIGFAVRDIEKAVRWYSDVFGFTRLVPPGICEMVLMGHRGYRCLIENENGDSLELEQRTDMEFPNNSSAIISHFSLNVDDLEAIRESLREVEEVTMDNDGEIAEKPDKRILYITGLDGIRIELIEDKK